MGEHEWAVPVAEGGHRVFGEIAGTPQTPAWSPVAVRLLRVLSGGRVLKRASMPWMASESLVFKGDARKAVGRELEQWGEFLPIDKHVLKPQVIGDVGVFKIRQLRAPLYLQGEVVDMIQSAGIVGTGFQLVWSDGMD